MGIKTRQEAEKIILDIFKSGSENTKLRLFENLIFQLPFELLTQIVKAEI